MNIEGVRFNLVNPEDLKLGFLIESPETWNQNTPVQKGLNDRHLGTSDERYSCLTCGQKSYCPGHEGYIPLCKPCFIPNMLDHVIKTLRCVCPVCSAILLPVDDIKEKNIDWISDVVTSHAKYRFCGQGRVTEDGDPVGCGSHRSNYVKIDGLHIKGLMYEPLDPIGPPDAEGEDGGEVVTVAKRKKIEYV